MRRAVTERGEGYKDISSCTGGKLASGRLLQDERRETRKQGAQSKRELLET